MSHIQHRLSYFHKLHMLNNGFRHPLSTHRNLNFYKEYQPYLNGILFDFKCHSNSHNLASHSDPSSNSTNSFSTLQTHSENAVIMKKKLPKNFVKDTYLPHLENQIAQHVHTLMPSQLVHLITAYSKLPLEIRHRVLAHKLSDQIKFRISAFRTNEAIDIIYPMYKMLPNDIALFETLAEHLSLPQNFLEIQTLQLISIARIYSKLRSKFEPFLEKIIPRLKTELIKYDSTELSDILSAIADFSHSSDANNDIDFLSIIIPIIEDKYFETSLLHSITNLSSLCKLKIFHKTYIDRITQDLLDTYRIRNLPPKYISKICWVYSKFGILEKISHTLFPLIQNNFDRFSSKDFSRLCQALPNNSQIPLKICAHLKPNIINFPRSEFLAFLLGCVRRGFFPLEDGSLHTSFLDQIETIKTKEDDSSVINYFDVEDLLENCLNYINIEQNNFSHREFQYLISLLLFSEHYQYLITRLPASFEELIKEKMEDYNIDRKL